MSAAYQYDNIVEFKGRGMSEETNEAKQAYKQYCDFMRLVRQTLTPSEYLVFEVIKDATTNGWYWLSFNELVWRTGGLTMPVIGNSISRLEQLDLLQVRRHPKNTQEANEYLAAKEPNQKTLDKLNQSFDKLKATKKSLVAVDLKATKKSLPTKENLVVATKESLQGLLKNLSSTVSINTIHMNDINGASSSEDGAEAPLFENNPEPKQEPKSVEPLPAKVSLRDRYKNVLVLIEQGNAPRNENGNKRTAAGVLAEMIMEIYGGASPDPAQVATLAKNAGGVWKAHDLILEHSKDKFNGTAINWLMGCVNQKNGSKPYYYPNSPPQQQTPTETPEQKLKRLKRGLGKNLLSLDEKTELETLERSLNGHQHTTV